MEKDILNKFSTPAKEALIRAQILTNKIGVSRIEPEYLLAALLVQKSGLSKEILRRAGIKFEVVKEAILKRAGTIGLDWKQVLEAEFRVLPFGKQIPGTTRARKSKTSTPFEMEKTIEQNELIKSNRLPSDTTESTKSPETLEEMEREIANLIREPLYKVNQANPTKERGKQNEVEDSLKLINLKLGPMTEKIIERAVNAAARFGHIYVGSEHLLFGLLNTLNEAVERIFIQSQVDQQKLKDQMNIILNSTAKFSDITQPERIGNFFRRLVTGELPGSEEESETPALDSFATNLTSEKIQKNVDPVIGRKTEIERLINILSRRTKNNPILIGEPGVGKTAIVEGLAKKIMTGEVPDILAEKKIFTLDLGLLVAGTSFRGDFENRIKHVIIEVKRDPDIILFIDEIHNIIGAGSALGTMDAANLLKPALSRGEIRCIGATTAVEYKKFIEPDPALERRFQPIFINESTKEEATELLGGIAKNYEKYHRVKITREAIEAAVNLSSRYIQDKFLPDKAIDLIDEAASKMKVKKANKGWVKEIKALKKKMNEIMMAKEKSVGEEKFEEAMKLKDEEDRLMTKIIELKEKQKKNEEKFWGRIIEEDVVEIVSGIIKIPKNQLSWRGGLSESELKLEDQLGKKIIGQGEVLKEVVNVIRKHLTGLTDPRRPLGSFMFLGPSGVGKTELARVMAQKIFHDEKTLIRFDMSEFGESFNVSKLIGAPAGYVGYRESGKLTEAVKNKPYSIVLFDEIEKAHLEVRNLLLQILEDGKLTDATGKEINFKNTIIAMTSNIGVSELNRTQAIGFDSAPDTATFDYERVKERVLTELKKNFNGEFLNRIDKILVFRPLTGDDLEKIVELQIGELNERLRERGLVIEISDEAKRQLAKMSFKVESGAREIRRNIADLVEGPLAEKMMTEEFTSEDLIKVEMADGKIVLR